MDSIASATMATGGYYTCSNHHAACWLHPMIFFALQSLCWMMLWNPSTIKRDLELQSTILLHNVTPSPFHCPSILYNTEHWLGRSEKLVLMSVKITFKCLCSHATPYWSTLPSSNSTSWTSLAVSGPWSFWPFSISASRTSIGWIRKNNSTGIFIFGLLYALI